MMTTLLFCSFENLWSCWWTHCLLQRHTMSAASNQTISSSHSREYLAPQHFLMCVLCTMCYIDCYSYLSYALHDVTKQPI